MGTHIGPLYVRRSGFIRATPERVWEEFTSFERLDAWFSYGHKMESCDPRQGGAIRLSGETDGVKSYFGGTILVFDPGRELTFTEDWETDPGPFPQLITIRLTPLYDGCHVELFHHGFERLGDAAAEELEGHEIGWHAHHIERLRAVVEKSSTG